MPKGYSLHVGVSNVLPGAHGGPKPAPGCDRAARTMHAIAVAQGFDALDPLIDEKATKLGFLDALVSLAKHLKAGDLLFLSIASHGILHVALGVPDEPRDQALLLFDGKIADDTLYDCLAAIPVAARIFGVTEACFSGSIFTNPTDLLSTASPISHARAASDDASVRLSGWAERTLSFAGASRPKVTANVLLLAAASDRKPASGLAPGSGGLPPFTQAFVDEWQAASSYDDLLARIDARATGPVPFARPVLNRNLVNDDTFVSERPLTIAP